MNKLRVEYAQLESKAVLLPDVVVRGEAAQIVNEVL